MGRTVIGGRRRHTRGNERGRRARAPACQSCHTGTAVHADLLFAAVAPAGGTCGSKPCWRASGKRKFVYRDPGGTPDGLRSLELTAGKSGKAAVAATGKGANLPLPFFPLPTPLRVQLQSQTAACFEATLSAPARNDAKKFKAKAH